jgi:hypothetical protein
VTMSVGYALCFPHPFAEYKGKWKMETKCEPQMVFWVDIGVTGRKGSVEVKASSNG